MAERVSKRAAAFGRLLRERREAKGLTRAAAAKAAGMTPQRWGQLELGRERRGGGLEIPVKPTRETVIKAARAVGWPAAEALAEAGYSPEPDTDNDIEFPIRDWERLTEVERQAFKALIEVVAQRRAVTRRFTDVGADGTAYETQVTRTEARDPEIIEADTETETNSC